MDDVEIPYQGKVLLVEGKWCVHLSFNLFGMDVRAFAQQQPDGSWTTLAANSRGEFVPIVGPGTGELHDYVASMAAALVEQHRAEVIVPFKKKKEVE